MYAQHYGTLPIACETGGLKDTVTDIADEENATGFTFQSPDSDAFTEAVARAVQFYANKVAWRTVQRRAMDQATAAEFGATPRLDPSAESGAAAVVLGDLGEGWDFRTLNRAFRMLMAEPQPALLALGMTRYWRAADGLRLDVAFFVRGLEHASGAEALVLGKPAPAFFAAALASLGSTADETVIVGDDVVGDVAGGQRAGLKGVLVRTGKFRPADLEGEIRPDAVLDSIADLRAWWEAGA